MKTDSDQSLLRDLWEQHKSTPFPKGFRGKGVSGIDFVMLDADVAGCVSSFLDRGNLNLYQTAILGTERFIAHFQVKEQKPRLFWIDRVGDLRTLKPQ